MTQPAAYAKSVKNVESAKILVLLSTIDVGANDILDNIGRLKAEDITLLNEQRAWAVTKSVNTSISKVFPRHSTDTPLVDAIVPAAQVVVAMTDYLKKKVQSYRQTVWSGEVMTVKQVYLLSFIEQLDYWVNYTNKMLDVLVTKATDPSANMERHLVPMDLKMLNGTMGYYTTVTNSLLKGKSELIREIDAIEDTDVDDETANAVNAMQGRKRPSLAQGFGIHVLWPGYWIGSVMMEIDLARIKRAQEQNEYLAAKINQAINKKNGVDDPRIDYQIETYNNKIIKNNARIENIVSSYQ